VGPYSTVQYGNISHSANRKAPLNSGKWKRRSRNDINDVKTPTSDLKNDIFVSKSHILGHTARTA